MDQENEEIINFCGSIYNNTSLFREGDKNKKRANKKLERERIRDEEKAIISEM